MPPLKGNALIGQSGGPTAVINQSLVGIVEECLASPDVGQVYGALQGIRGVLEENFVDLGRESREELERVALTPCAALRSVRAKPDRKDCQRALKVFRAHDIRFFFYIGGNDSAETAHLLNEVAVEEDYEVRLFHVPKTIDNDLRETDHCPGYGSAAKFVIQALQGDNEDNRSLGGVKIDVIMGRSAGWLTAASALARRGEGEGPHLIYMPETDFSLESFVGHVDATMAEHGRCVIAVSEGIHDADGNLIAAPKEKDTFGNVQLSGTGFLGDRLVGAVRESLGSELRVRADTFGYLQRSFFGVVSAQDSREARDVGRTAARIATSGEVPHGSVIILRDEEDGAYRPRYDWCPLENVARLTKEMPAEFLVGDHDVSPAFLDYLRPLVGDLPPTGRLVGYPVPKRF